MIGLMMALIKPKITATMISVLATDASLETAEVPWRVHCSVWIPGTAQAAMARATAVTRILTRIFMALFLQDATRTPPGTRREIYGTGTGLLVRPGGARGMPQGEGGRACGDAGTMLSFGVIDL